MRGPIDFIVVEFAGNKFKGEVLKELDSAIKNKTIAVLDLALISKNKSGDVSSIELAKSDDEVIRRLEKSKRDSEGIINDEDIAEVGEVLENNSTAGLLIIEQLWVKGLNRALEAANGLLVAEGRIHPQAVYELESREFYF